MKRIIAVLLVLVMVLSLCACSKKNLIEDYRLEISGEKIGLGSDDGYLEINGIDNGKTSMLYFEMAGSTGRVKGPVYKIQEREDYVVYKFYVDSLSGTAIEESDYIYLYHYPNRGDHGIIEIKGNDLTMCFKKVK